MSGKKKSALSSYEDNPEKMGDVLTKMATQGTSINEDDVKFYIEAWGRKSDSSRAQSSFCNTALAIFKKGYGSYIVKNGGVNALISIFKQCSGDVDLSISACHVLDMMLQDEFEGDSLGPFKEEDGVKALISALSERLDSADLQKVGIDVVQRLVADSGVQKILCDNEGIERLMHILILHQRDRAIQIGALKILASLASTDDQRAQIVENLGIDSVTTTMGHFSDDPEVLGACCRALGYIVVSLELAMALPNSLAEAFNSLETTLATSPTASPLLSKKKMKAPLKGGRGGVLKDPNEGIIEGLRRQIRAADKGAIPLVVSAIETFIDDTEIQKWGCFTLASMSYKNPITSTAILDGGGIDAVLLVATHASTPTVLELVMYSLSRLAMDDACAQQIWDSCGVKVLLDRAKASARSPGILTNVFVCLGYLACNPRASSEIGMVGGVKPIVAAMRACAADADLQRSALFALGRLALNPANAEMIGFEQGVAAAISALEAFPDDNGVQQFGIDFLVNMAADHAGNVLSAGGVSVAEAAMKGFINDPNLQSSCAALLENMACYRGCTPQHFPANLIIAVGRSFKKHIKEPAVVESFARAIANIALVGPSTCEDLLEYGVVSHALFALMKCQVSHSMGVYLARFLANILLGTPRGAAKQRCFSGGIIPALASVMDTYPHSLEAQYECSRAIAALVTGTKVPPQGPSEVVHNAKLFVNALNEFCEDPAVAHACCVVLSVAILADEAMVAPVVSGSLMLKAMRLHSGDVRLQVACCEVLNVIISISKAKKSLAEAEKKKKKKEKKKKEEKEGGEDSEKDDDDDDDDDDWKKDKGVVAVCNIARAAGEALNVNKAIIRTLKSIVDNGGGGKEKLKKSDIEALTIFAKNVGGKYSDDDEDSAEFISIVL